MEANGPSPFLLPPFLCQSVQDVPVQSELSFGRLEGPCQATFPLQPRQVKSRALHVPSIHVPLCANLSRGPCQGFRSFFGGPSTGAPCPMPNQDARRVCMPVRPTPLNHMCLGPRCAFPTQRIPCQLPQIQAVPRHRRPEVFPCGHHVKRGLRGGVVEGCGFRDVPMQMAQGQLLHRATPVGHGKRACLQPVQTPEVMAVEGLRRKVCARQGQWEQRQPHLIHRKFHLGDRCCDLQCGLCQGMSPQKGADQHSQHAHRQNPPWPAPGRGGGSWL